jgi:cytochrome P450
MTSDSGASTEGGTRHRRPAAKVDVFDPRRYRDGVPYDDLRILREQGPAVWHPEPAVLDWPAGRGFWAITSYDAVVHVSRTPEAFSVRLGGSQLRDPAPEDLEFVRQMMLNMDPPRHTRLRSILNKGFTPRAVSRLEPDLRRFARTIVAAVVDDGGCDFAEDIGADFPLLTLATIMGVPLADRRLLLQWTNRIIGYQDDEYAQTLVDEETGEPINPRSRRALADMLDYAGELARFKRQHPADDIITELLFAEVDGQRLSTEEFENFFFLFTVAGNDTTHSAIPGGMLALLEHPDQLQRLRADPALLDDAIEEMLRYCPPVIHFRRTATRDVEVGDAAIVAGDKVAVFYPAANRDPSVFTDPDSFDITRRPNRHLTFGIGPHFCLGSGLARLQMRVMFTELLHRLDSLELAGPVERLQSNFINGIKHMPVRFAVT